MSETKTVKWYVPVETKVAVEYITELSITSILIGIDANTSKEIPVKKIITIGTSDSLSVNDTDIHFFTNVVDKETAEEEMLDLHDFCKGNDLDDKYIEFTFTFPIDFPGILLFVSTDLGYKLPDN